MSVSPEGNLIALTSGTDSTVLLWDLNKRKITGELKRSYKSSITNVVFSPDGKLLASIGTDQESYAHLWDSKTHKLLGDLDPDRYSVPFLYLIAFSPDGRMLAAAGGQGQGEILLWDVYTHRRLGSRINASATFVTSIAFSPDGSTLASGSLDGTVRLWDPVSHDLIATLAEAQKSKRVAASIAYSPDGKVLAWGNEADGTINLWDVSSYSRLAVGKPFEFYAYRLGFSPDGRVLATVKLGPKDHQTQLWDVASRQRLGEPIANVSRVRFSPDGNSLAAANDDDTVSLLGLADHSFSGQRLEGHVGDVQRIAFSPDGKTLATVGFDKTPQQHNVMLTQWNVATRKLAGPPVISPDLIQSHLAFSPDGATMVLGRVYGILIAANRLTKSDFSTVLLSARTAPH